MRAAPPPLARRLFAACLHEVDRDAVLGDLEETYAALAGRYGVRRARRWYRGQVARSFLPFLVRSCYWSLVMLQSYWKLAVRTLLKNGTYTVINVLGLGMALAMCITAYVTYDYNVRYDAFHTRADVLYRINSVKQVGGEEQPWGLSPLPLAEVLREHVAGVERVTRWRYAGAVVRHGDQLFNEQVAFADPDFFQMFTFPLEGGGPDVLRHNDRIVLTREMADKYFPGEQAVGQQLSVRFGEGTEHVFTVGAVAAPYPDNSSITFDFVAPYDVFLATTGLARDDWKHWGAQTFVQLSDPARAPELERQLAPYVAVQNAARPDWTITRFYAEPLRVLAPNGRETRGHDLRFNVPPSAIIGSCVTAVLVLLMACSNFVNLSVVAAGRRMKEIGVRKVMGGRRRQLVGQFMGENLLLCLLALLAALALAKVLVPLYDSLWPFMTLELSYRDNLPLFAFLTGLVLATGLLAGAYPAFYASAFNPVRILRGTQRMGRATPLSRVLLGFQFTLTILGLGGSFLFAQNARYQETLDMGYARDGLLVVPLDEPATFAALRDAVAGHPAVQHVGGSRSHVAYSFGTATLRYGDAEHEVERYDIGEGYLEAAGLQLVAGRALAPEREADRATAVLVNETLARQLGWDDPVGQFVTMDSVRFSVVGVVRDFYSNGVWEPIDPVVLRVAPPERYGVLVVQAPPARLPEVDAFVERAWRAQVPDVPYEGFFQDERLVEGVAVSQSIRKMFGFIAVVTLLIAGTGLFALVSLNIARRTKEIGIRKALGATALHIGQLVNREFVLLLGAAAVVAGASGYYTMDLLLDSIYAYHVDVGPGPFLLATALILVLALACVGGRVYRAATSNPVDALRSE